MKHMEMAIRMNNVTTNIKYKLTISQPLDTEVAAPGAEARRSSMSVVARAHSV